VSTSFPKYVSFIYISQENKGIKEIQTTKNSYNVKMSTNKRTSNKIDEEKLI